MSDSLAGYFDYNATSPLLRVARDALVAALDGGFGNPSSAHGPGRRARALVDRAREEVAALVGADPRQVIFTSGATEALSLAVFSAGPGPVVGTSLEHPALPAAAAALGRAWRPVRVSLDGPEGALDASSLSSSLAAAGGDAALVACIAAHNVTGLILPVGQLALAPSSCRLLVDASQLAGRLPVGPLLGDARVDYLALAAHKLGGPKGIGALVVHPDAPLRPLFPGGGQEAGRRGGTEAVPLIAAFGAAAAWAMRHRDAEALRLSALRDDLEAALSAAGLRVIGRAAPRLPQTSALILPRGLLAETMVQWLGAEGFAVSAGSACSTGSALPSPALLGLGLDPDAALGAIRISLGAESTADGTRALVAAVARGLEALGRCPPNP